MLSDFDLAKHSGVTGGRPAAIHRSGLDGVSMCRFFPLPPRGILTYDQLASSGGHEILHGKFPDKFVCGNRRLVMI